MTVILRNILVSTITQADRRAAHRPGFNPYALGITLGRLGEVMADIERGAEVRAAILAGFCGPLCDRLLKAAGLPVRTPQERRSAGPWYYQPVTPEPQAAAE